MSTFDPADHPRADNGRFTKASTGEATVELSRDERLSAGWRLPDDGKRLTVEIAGQLRFAAGWRGVPGSQAHQVFEDVRSQWEATPPDQRPSPPESWVKGLSGRGWNNDPVALPSDPASAWALYRVQSDRELFDDSATEYASVDLETASEPGKWGPKDGSIIEAAVITYDSRGYEVDSHSELYAPDQAHLKKFGTGAADIHQITPEMVADAPHFSQRSGEVARALSGRVMLAQNARFEKSWLAKHSSPQDGFEQTRVVADTYVMARQHLQTPNHKLETICSELGVDYTGGHRAEHDARVAAQVFFALRERIFDDYDARYRAAQ